MQVLNLKSDPNVDEKELQQKTVLEKDYEKLVVDEAIIKVDGNVECIYKKLPLPANALLTELRKIKYSTHKRTKGLATHSRTFGFLPRNVIRKDYCSRAGLITTNPKAEELLELYAGLVDEMYQEYLPEAYMAHKAMVEEQVLPEYRFGKSLFTSGIINQNNKLHYHFDRGNFEGSFGAMITFRNHVEGGALVIPKIHAALETGDNTIAIFNSQKFLHGVSPFKLLTPNSYRLTLVFYSMRGMAACLPREEEMKRIEKIKTERAMKRVRGEVSI